MPISDIPESMVTYAVGTQREINDLVQRIPLRSNVSGGLQPLEAMAGAASYFFLDGDISTGVFTAIISDLVIRDAPSVITGIGPYLFAKLSNYDFSVLDGLRTIYRYEQSPGLIGRFREGFDYVSRRISTDQDADS